MDDPTPLRLLPRGEQQSPSPVIQLTSEPGYLNPNRCRHREITVDKYDGVECLRCQKRLDPLAILIRMAQAESRWQRERALHLETLATLEAKSRTKCRHCGKMTPVKT